LPRFDACCQDCSVIERFEIKVKARESLSPIVKHVEAIITALIAAMQANSCRLVTISRKRNKCKIYQTSKYTVLYVKKKTESISYVFLIPGLLVFDTYLTYA